MGVDIDKGVGVEKGVVRDDVEDRNRIENLDVHIDGLLGNHRGGRWLAVTPSDARAAARELGFPDQFDPREIAAMLRDLQVARGHLIAYMSRIDGLEERIGMRVIDASKLVEKFSNVADSQSIGQFIDRLVSR